jgi:hypothetical protein
MIVAKDKPKIKRVGLSIPEEEKIKARLRRRLPSEAWVDATFFAAEEIGPDGEAIVYTFHNAKAFPPGGRDTKMVTCPHCLRVVPPIHLEAFKVGERPDGREKIDEPSELCADHKEERFQDAWGESPSARAIQQLQHLNLRIEERKLPAESRAALRREIKRAVQIGSR